jgi:hypothetical protein
MAITATLSVDNTAPTASIANRWTLLLANSVANAVNILDITFVDAANDPLALQPDGVNATDIRPSFAMGQSGFAPSGGVNAQNRQIPGAGNITLNFVSSFFGGPRQPAVSQALAYPVGVVVRTDDGSITVSNTLIITASPAFAGYGFPGAYPSLPQVGQARFESNITGSPMTAVLFPTPS